MVFIYSKRRSNRLIYIFDLIFKDLIGVNYTIVDKLDQFKEVDGPKLSYSPNQIENEIHFCSTNLLFEIGVEDQNIEVKDYDGMKGFYQTSKKSILPFDPFAASFYLVSRYEEYLPFSADRFGRFPAKESLAYKEGFLDVPIVNIWAAKIKSLLIEKYPELSFAKREFSYQPTFDIDCAFAFKKKGIFRVLGGFFSSFMNKDFEQFKHRLRVVFKNEKDPFDTFDWILSLQKKYQLKPKFFFLVGDYGEYDKNIPLTVNEFKYLVKSIADYAEVGVHPSFASNTEPGKLKEEIHRLEEVLNREIKISRQHFLKLALPRTYQNLIEHDIFDDYTMGYASEIGFRASICSPFYFFDLDYEVQTRLKVHSFAFMDVTLNLYKKYSTEEALEAVQKVIQNVQDVNGTLISLWHNQNLSDLGVWKGWKDLYEKMTSEAFVIQVKSKYK